MYNGVAPYYFMQFKAINQDTAIRKKCLLSTVKHCPQILNN